MSVVARFGRAVGVVVDGVLAAVPRRALRQAASALPLDALRASAAGRYLDAQRRRLDLYHPTTIITLRVDLTQPSARLRDADRRELEARALRLAAIDAETYPALHRWLTAEAPARVAHAERRYAQRCPGFVLFEQDAVVGCVYFAPGGDGAARDVHPDLEWLELCPRTDEVYTYDYFVSDRARGVGRLFVRAVQAAQAAEGFVGAYGYVYADNTAALWLYRTTGWREVSRRVEHRVLRRLLLIGREVYVIDWRRTPARVHVVRLSPGVAARLDAAMRPRA